MILKRFIALFLIILSISALFISCGEKDGESQEPGSENSSKSDDSSTEPNENTNPLAHIPEQNLDQDFIFLVEGDYRQGYKSVEIVEFEETAISEYVRERNILVEEHLGIRIKEVRTSASGEMLNKIRNAASSGEIFHAAMPYMVDIAPAVGESIVYDLREFSDIIKLDAPYWDQNANKSLSIKNKLYFTTGDISLLTMDVTHCMVFNRSLVTKLDLDNPYELVENGTWTIDKMLEMASHVTSDLNGDNNITWEDNIGAFINGNYANSFFIGANENFALKDSNDIPYISLMSSTSPDVFSKIYEVFNSKDVIRTELFQNEALAKGHSSCYYAAREALANDRALFVAISLSDIHDLSNYEDASFGILVTPKYNQEQENYNSYISVIFATSCVIPTSLTEDEAKISALVLEAMNAASAETVKKNYYERVIKLQKIQDDEGERMLDFIFNNRVYDIGSIYNFGSIRDFVSGEAQKPSNSFISSYEANRGIMENQLEELLNNIN